MVSMSDEIKAMGKCVEMLVGLTREEQARALAYLTDRFVYHPRSGEAKGEDNPGPMPPETNEG
jgi:hypothetical protein